MRSSFRVLSAALLITGCAIQVAGPNGVRTINLGPKSAYDTLKEVNERVNTTRKLLIKRVGDDWKKEQAELDQAGQELASERAALSPELQSEGAAYKSVADNLSDAESWYASSKLAFDAERALRAALDADAAGTNPTAQQLADVDTKVKAFGAHARDEWKNVAEGQGRRLAELRQAIAEGPKRRQEAKARSETQAKAKALDQQQKAASEVGRAANEALHGLYGVMAKHDVPEEAALVELEKRAAAVEAVIPTGGQFYANEAGLMRIYANLSEPDGADRLKGQLGGDLSKGEAHGKEFKVAVKVPKDHCAVFFGKIISWSGSEEIIAPKTDAPVSAQEFRIGWANEAMLADKWKGIVGRGVCATQPMTVTFSGGLKVAGSKNGLRYAVLDFQRAAFPVLLATHLDLSLPDHCDGEAWAGMFMNPVPGTIAYLDGEPVLVLSSDPVGGNRDMSVKHAGKLSDWSTVKKSNLQSMPPSKVRFKEPFTWAECPQKDGDVMPRGAASRAIVECGQAIEKKYAAAWDQVDAARQAADNVSNNQVKFYNPAAEEKAGRLRSAYDADFEQRCQPLVERTKKQLEARFTKLVDQLTDAPPKDPLKRADLAASEEDAPFRRW